MGAVDILRGAANLQLFADLTRNIPNESYVSDTPDGGKAINYAAPTLSVGA